ncbi:hypothetical protein PQI07_31250 [Methylobacterium sp. 092160098-2]|uniref:hypothetical protein n=1 Tax=Methylobacterium sp. 092160098-2 TaxID=3025129 RepID=UPI002381BF1E|nr:hypothetical protein [Methylobacterium sp. 092160098-2]MDE4915112.1 hypothetical protein [Methylobacterium sp. 092160098-2]
MVDADEVRRLLQDGTPRAGYTKREVGKVAAGLSQEVVVALVARGRLTVAEEFCPANRRRIPVVTRESVEAFTARYATVAEIGKANGIPARTALRLLQEAGVRAAFDTSTVDAWIYERSMVGDAMQILQPTPFTGPNRSVGRADRGLAPGWGVQLLEG